jgi:hypothetical protein
VNIEDLTIGDARKLVALFGNSNGNAPAVQHPAVGKYVIVRAARAGVHAGILVSAHEGEVELRESRRIWSWTGALSCSEIALHGITGGKVAVQVPSQFISEEIEIIPASAEAEKCLRKI